MKVKTTKKYIELLITLSLTTLVSGCLSNADLKPETSKRVLDYPECNLSYKTYGVHGILTNANFNTVVNNCINQKEKKIEREKALDKNPICKKKFEYSHASGIACSVKIENEKTEAALAEKKNIYMESPKGNAELKSNKEFEAKEMREEALATKACEVKNREGSRSYSRSTIRLTGVKKISKNTYRCSSWIDDNSGSQIMPVRVNATINIETGEYKERRHH